MKKIKKKIKI